MDGLFEAAGCVIQHPGQAASAVATCAGVTAFNSLVTTAVNYYFQC